MLKEVVMHNITLIMSSLFVISLLLAIVVIRKEAGVLRGELGDVKRGTFFCLMLLIIGFVICCGWRGLNFKSFYHSSQEWEAFIQAKNIVLGDKDVFDNTLHGLGYPLLIVPGFKIFGFNPMVASILNLTLAVLSICLVFYLSKIVFQKDIVALISAALYATHPHTFLFAAYIMGEPTTLGFFLLMITISGILAFRYHRINIHLLTLLFIAASAQIKLEYYALIIPYILCFILFREHKKGRLIHFMFVAVIFLCMSVPVFTLNHRLRTSYSSGWASMTQNFHDGQEYFYSIHMLDRLDTVLKAMTNNSFSFVYMFYDMPNFLRFWASEYFWLFSVFALAGITIGLSGRLRKECTIVALIFIFLNWTYLAASVFYEHRFAIPSFGLVVIFAGFCVYVVAEKAVNLSGRMKIRAPVMIGLSVILILSPTLDFVEAGSLISDLSAPEDIDIYDKTRSIVEKVSPNDAFIIVFVEGGFYDVILKFLGYETECLGGGNYLGLDYHRRTVSTDEWVDNLMLPFHREKDNYFLILHEGYQPHPLDKRAMDYYELTKVKQIDDMALYHVGPGDHVDFNYF